MSPPAPSYPELFRWTIDTNAWSIELLLFVCFSSPMGRLERGLHVTRQSASVLREHPQLAVFPLLSITAVLTSLAGLAVVSFAIGLFNPPDVSVDGLIRVAEFSEPLDYAAYFIAILAVTTVATFFNAALVSCIHRVLLGEAVSIRSGLRAAWRVKQKILVYSLAAATIGVMIRLLDEHLHIGSGLSAWLFSLGWSVLTFFIVPVLVLEEDTSPRLMFRRSRTIFTETWGESMTADFGISLIGFLVFVPILVVGGWFILSTGHVWPLGLLIAAFIALSVVTSTLGSVVRTHLYLYARDGPTASSLELEPSALLKGS